MEQPKNFRQIRKAKPILTNKTVNRSPSPISPLNKKCPSFLNLNKKSKSPLQTNKEAEKFIQFFSEKPSAELSFQKLNSNNSGHQKFTSPASKILNSQNQSSKGKGKAEQSFKNLIKEHQSELSCFTSGKKELPTGNSNIGNQQQNIFDFNIQERETGTIKPRKKLNTNRFSTLNDDQFEIQHWRKVSDHNAHNITFRDLIEKAPIERAPKDLYNKNPSLSPIPRNRDISSKKNIFQSAQTAIQKNPIQQGIKRTENNIFTAIKTPKNYAESERHSIPGQRKASLSKIKTQLIGLRKTNSTNANFNSEISRNAESRSMTIINPGGILTFAAPKRLNRQISQLYKIEQSRLSGSNCSEESDFVNQSVQNQSDLDMNPDI